MKKKQIKKLSIQAQNRIIEEKHRSNIGNNHDTKHVQTNMTSIPQF